MFDCRCAVREILASDSASADTVSEATGVSLLHLVSGSPRRPSTMCVYVHAVMYVGGNHNQLPQCV